MKKIAVLLLIGLTLTGCGNKEYFKQIYLDDMEAFMDEGKEGFVLVVTENNESFQDYVKDVAEKEKVEIAMYNVYESEEGAADERPMLPYDEIERFSELYYLEGNEAKDSLAVKDYEDKKLTEEITHFVNLHK